MFAALSASPWLFVAALAALAVASYWRETRKTTPPTDDQAPAVVTVQRTFSRDEVAGLISQAGQVNQAGEVNHQAGEAALASPGVGVATLRGYVRTLRAELAQLTDADQRTNAAADLDGIAGAIAALQQQLDGDAAAAATLTAALETAAPA